MLRAEEIRTVIARKDTGLIYLSRLLFNHAPTALEERPGDFEQMGTPESNPEQWAELLKVCPEAPYLWPGDFMEFGNGHVA